MTTEVYLLHGASGSQGNRSQWVAGVYASKSTAEEDLKTLHDLMRYGLTEQVGHLLRELDPQIKLHSAGVEYSIATHRLIY